MEPKDLFEELINLVKYNESELENKDLLFLYSLKKESLKDFLKGTTPDIDRPTNAFLFNDNLYSDFIKLIKVPSFMFKLKDLFTKYDTTDPAKDSKFMKHFFIIFKNIFAKDPLPDGLFPDVHGKSTRNFDYTNYFLINGKFSGAATEFFKDIVPMILFKMYLECSIYIYTNIVDNVNKCFELSTKIGTSDQYDVSYISEWIDQRCNIYNKLNSASYKLKMYDSDKKITFDSNNFKYFNILDLYSNDEIKKIEYLITYRGKLKKNFRYYKPDGSYNRLNTANSKKFDSDLANFMIDKYVPVPDNMLASNKCSIEFLIFQTLNTYDQIIKEMIKVRLSFLKQVKETIRTDDATNDQLRVEAPKMIATLKQFVNYPLTFQYKFKKFESCFSMLSETTMKNILYKYIKLAQLKKYFLKNDISIDNQSFDQITNVNADILDKLSIKKTVFEWDKYDSPLNNEPLINLLTNMKDAELEINDDIGPDLETELINRLETILTNFRQRPFLVYNPPTDVEHYETIYKINWAGNPPKGLPNDDSVIKVNLLPYKDAITITDLRNIVYVDDNSFHIYTYNVVKPAVLGISPIVNVLNQSISVNDDIARNYYDSNYATITDELNNLKVEFNSKLEKIKKDIESFVQNLTNMQDSLTGFIDCIQNIRYIIDKGYDDWITSYAPLGGVFIDPRTLTVADQTPFIDYISPIKTQNNINFRLTCFNNDFANSCQRLKSFIDSFNKLYTSIIKDIDELIPGGATYDNFISKINQYRIKITADIARLDTTIKTGTDKIDLVFDEKCKIINIDKQPVDKELSEITAGRFVGGSREDILALQISTKTSEIAALAIPGPAKAIITRASESSAYDETAFIGKTISGHFFTPAEVAVFSEYNRLNNELRGIINSRKLALTIKSDEFQEKSEQCDERIQQIITNDNLEELVSQRRCLKTLTDLTIFTARQIIPTYLDQRRLECENLKQFMTTNVKNHMDNVLFRKIDPTGPDVQANWDQDNLKFVADRMKDSFSALQKYIKILNKLYAEECVDMSGLVKKDFALHRVKQNVFKLIVSGYNTVSYYRPENLYNYANYDVNHICASLELVSCELFKNNKRVPVFYRGLDKISTIDEDVNLSTFTGTRSDTLTDHLKTFLGAASDCMDQEAYHEKLNDFYSSNVSFDKTFAKTKECSAFRYAEEGGELSDIASLDNLDETVNNHNISVYQLLDYFNNSPILNMCEIFYNYLVMIREIPELPSIDALINILKQIGYVDPFWNFIDEANPLAEPRKPYVDKPPGGYDFRYSRKSRDNGLRNYKVYNGSFSAKKDIELIKALFEDIMDTDEFNYLLYNLDNDSANVHLLNKLNDDYMFINTEDVQNSIYFNPLKLIKLMHYFDEKKFLKYMFKQYRRQNIENTSNLTKGNPTKLIFDDYGFYRCERQRKYMEKGPVYDLKRFQVGYFSLGVVSDDKISFTNKINDVIVDILELTNGRF